MSHSVLKDVLPADYGYVVLVACDGILVNFYLMKKVMQARKEHNVQYPALYSTSNDTFNCIQRAHQNYLETLPVFFTSLLVGGLQNPRTAALGGTLYLIGRMASARGYSTGDPSKRTAGRIPAMVGGLMLLGNLVCFGVVHADLLGKCKSMFNC